MSSFQMKARNYEKVEKVRKTVAVYIYYTCICLCCHDDSTINAVLVIVILLHCYYNIVL